MNIDKYNKVSESSQLNILDEFGVLLGEREDRFCRIKLYQIDNFYVEVYLHTHFNVVVKIQSSTDTDCLEPYIENMDINSLFSI